MTASRRSFLKGTLTSAAAVLGSGAAPLLGAAPALTPGPGNKWPGRVAITFNKNAVTGTTPSEAVIKKMVDDTILLLTGESTVGAAWKAVFPAALTLQSKIAIKINILNNGLPRPSEFSVMAIAAGLQQMDFNGTRFPAANITIYDANNSNTMDSAGYTAARFPGIARVKDTFQNYGNGARNLSYATTLNACTFLINVFSPRGIGSNNAEGFTLGFKSHYGTYINPRDYHGTSSPAHLRDINCIGPVLSKTALNICSGIFGMNEGSGPTGGAADYSIYAKKIDPASTATSPCTIMMSTDPVSVEVQTIKMMRMNRNPTADYSVNALPTYLRASGGVTGALTPVYNIGVIDETRMEIRKIVNDQTAMAPQHQGKPQQQRLRIVPQPDRGVTTIEYATRDLTARQALLRIADLTGAKRFETALAISGGTARFVWDQRDRAGRRVAPGSYVATLVAGGTETSRRFTLG